MRHWLKNNDYSTLLKNYSSLSLVQLSNYILPLMTLPYLARTLGATNFGLVIMAQATMIYLTLITDYGFGLSATKNIAENQKNIEKVSEIFSTVMSIKMGLLLVGFLILHGLITFIPVFKAHQVLFYSSFLIVIGNTFLPSFLFQGLEKMTFIAIFNLFAKIGFTGLIFLMINTPTDYQWVHAIWGCSYIMVAVVAFLIIFSRFKIKLKPPNISNIQATLNHSFEYFLSRIAIAIYLNTNVILVGILLSTENAGYYGGAEKLLFAITTFYAPLIETIYPYISRTKNIPFIKKILAATTSLNTIGCMAAFFLGPLIVPLILGSTFKPATELFQWMLIIALLHLPASMIGYPVLGALGYEKTANRSVIIGAITHLLLVIICYPLITQPLHFIWIMIASQFIIFMIRVIKLLQIQKHHH